MKKTDFQHFLNSDSFIFLDGALGTELQKAGLISGENSAVYGYKNPEVLKKIHSSYIEAGAQLIFTNTFGSSAYKLAGTGFKNTELIKSAVTTAKEAAADKAFVGFDCGPLGALLKPDGSMTFDEAYDDFAAQFSAAQEAGADFAIIETMSDLHEVKIALLAAKENSSLPVLVSMSFEADGRTFTGTDPLSFVTLAESLGVSALGINCSGGPEQMLPILRQILKVATKPVLFKPNAGLPDPETGIYPLSPEDFAALMAEAANAGVKLLGGCCGTTPEHIKALSKAVSPLSYSKPQVVAIPRVCSVSRTVEIGTVPLLVGERLNPTGKKILRQALLAQNYEEYQKIAVQQQQAGADMLDVNCGLPGIDEKAAMIEAVAAVQSVSNLPLQIDSDKAEVLEAGLRLVRGRPVINSMNGKESSLSQVIPLAKKYGAMTIILPIDENGIPSQAEGRINIFEKIIARCEKEGLPKENLIADCLVMTAAAEPDAALQSLKTIRLVKERLGLPIMAGLSNISFGLPMRRLLNQIFYAQALAAGLDMAIVNPEHEEMQAVRTAHMALNGQDKNHAVFIAYAKSQEASKKESGAIESKPMKDAYESLEKAILQGFENEASRFAEKELEKLEPMEIIQSKIIPALDLVGQMYQDGKIFLPQLLQSAKAAQKALIPIKAAIEQKKDREELNCSEAVNRKILVATVEGDIHDIGKNIAKAVL